MLGEALSFAGAIFIVLALLDVDPRRCTFEVFVGSALLSASVALYVSPLVGLAMLFLFSGVVTALLYLATMVLPRPKVRAWRRIATAIVAGSALATLVTLVAVIRAGGITIAAPTMGKLEVPHEDFMAATLLFVAANLAVLAFMGGEGG
ncbi:MAG: hypothetical protein ABWK00_06765 [Desulfurococcaceae archaeon]